MQATVLPPPPFIAAASVVDLCMQATELPHPPPRLCCCPCPALGLCLQARKRKQEAAELSARQRAYSPAQDEARR